MHTTISVIRFISYIIAVLCLSALSNISVAFTVLYNYDDNGRVIVVNYGNSQQIIAYTYDDAGNILSKTVSVAEQLPPTVFFTSPPDGAYINSLNVMIKGDASDGGQGDSGIAWVDVNGVAASNANVGGSQVANWDAVVPLAAGSNVVTVTAADGSPWTNQTQQNIALNYIPFSVDSDGDGLDDSFEVAIGTNPNIIDSDGDGITDDAELAYDGDSTFFDPATDTDPMLSDTDGDTLSDDIDPNPLVVDITDGDLAPLGAPDGNLNAADLLIMQRIIHDQIIPGPVELLHGDLYSDGILNLQDLILQQQLILQ